MLRPSYHGAVSTAQESGPFYHGTTADLRAEDLLSPGFPSNYRPDVIMNHIYFTALLDGAGLAAELASELAPDHREPRVYAVEPTGGFEDDPNVTDKKFPGNPTRSYRSDEPIRVVAEVAEWTRLTPEALQQWRDRLTGLTPEARGEILN
ncbi:NAD(+)--rifampin ADP-ribosyltransferase [Leifsonia lichenia]